MQTNHTPGPWIAEGSALTIAPALEGANRRHLATFHGHATESDRLKIAAAPEMLDRLHLWRNWAECAEPADQVPPQLYAATLETLGKADPDMNWADGETFDRLSRVRNEAPAMLAALRKAQELLRDLEAPAHLEEGAALDDEVTAILARIDGTPTDEPAETCETCGFAPRPAPADDSCDCGPTAQPDLAAALADLFERGSWHELAALRKAQELLALSGISHGPIADDPAD